MSHPHDDRRSTPTSSPFGRDGDRYEVAITSELDLSKDETLALLRAAVERTFESDKAAAFELGVAKDRFSKWMRGTERFPVVALMRHKALFRAFVEVAHDAGYRVRELDRWDRLKLVTVRCLKVLCCRVERELRRDLGKAAAL